MAENASLADIRDQRTARAVIASVVPVAEHWTHHVLRLNRGDALATLQAVLGDDPIPGAPTAEARIWRRRFTAVDLDTVLERIERGWSLGQQIIVPGDSSWPQSLVPDDHRSPFALWAQGETPLLGDQLESRIAIIGEETPSEYGAATAAELTEQLLYEGRTIVAFPRPGISKIATEVAVAESRPVVLVMSQSLELPVPDFDGLHGVVTRTGLLVSTQPPGGMPWHRSNHESRQLLAAISGVTTIVEAEPRSEWLKVAAEARGFGRQIAAVPGRVSDWTSAITNELIRTGEARLVTEGSEITELVDRPSRSSSPEVVRAQSRPGLLSRVLQEPGISR